MRGAARLLVVTLLGVVVVLVAGPVVAAASEDEDVVVVQPTTTPPPTSAPSVELDPADTEADRSERNRKLAMGIASVVLVGIVIWGRSIRAKRKRKAEGKK